jgi:hypothetical protein
MDILLELVYND